jgi:hypothetical protein
MSTIDARPFVSALVEQHGIPYESASMLAGIVEATATEFPCTRTAWLDAHSGGFQYTATLDDGKLSLTAFSWTGFLND